MRFPQPLSNCHASCKARVEPSLHCLLLAMVNAFHEPLTEAAVIACLPFTNQVVLRAFIVIPDVTVCHVDACHMKKVKRHRSSAVACTAMLAAQ